jgi:mRNA interferase HigB
MRVVGRETLVHFRDQHADVRDWIDNWLADVESAQWRTPQDIKRTYSTASFLSANLVIFNVKGNNYRLEVQVAYQTGIVVIRWAGTHAEYTRRRK